MSETKTERSRFFGALFDRELARLDKLSREGWQLTARTTDGRRLMYDPGRCFRHALDCRLEHNEGMYLSLQKEAGWELVCHLDSMQGSKWYFFRKAYDPALPEAEYQLFTDEESFMEMKDRAFSMHWAILAVCWIGLIFCVGTLFLNICLTPILYILAAALFLSAHALVKRMVMNIGTRKERSPRWRTALWITAMVLCCICFVTGYLYQRSDWDYGDSEIYSAPYTSDLSSIDVTVPRPNFYTLSLIAHPDVPTTITFTNKKGEDLAQFVNSETHSQDYRLFLWPGTYTITTDFYPFEPPAKSAGDYHYFLFDDWDWF